MKEIKDRKTDKILSLSLRFRVIEIILEKEFLTDPVFIRFSG